MARYYYSGARDTTDGSKKIELSWLLKNNFLSGYRYEKISWSMNGDPRGDINIQINTCLDNPNIKFSYKARKRGEEEWTDMDFSFTMESLPCRFGGKKWFFICGLYKNGQYCGRRVRILYPAGNYFGCRNCADLSYDSCNLSGIAKSFGKIISIPDLEKMEAEVKRTYYKGKPTKKYLRYLRMENRFETGFIGMSLLFSRKFKKIKGAKNH